MPYTKHPHVKRAVQIGRAGAYGMLAGAGGTIFYVGDPYPWRYVAMGLFLAVGATMCLLGQITDRWLGELMGLPLVGTAMMVFAVLTLRDSGWSEYTAPSIFVLTAFGLLFVLRWTDQFMLARNARFMAQTLAVEE